MKRLQIALMLLAGCLVQLALGKERGPLRLDDNRTRLNAFSSTCVPVTPDQVVRLINRGSSRLEFLVDEHPPVHWLRVDPLEAQIDAGARHSVALHFHPAGLVRGAYRTWVRFANADQPRNFVEILVTLYVGAIFVPGDVVETFFWDVWYGPTHFDGFAGMELTLSWNRKVFGTPEAGLWMQVLDPTGQAVGNVTFDNPDPSSFQSIKLETTGRHTLELFPLNLNLMSNSMEVGVKTGRILPKPFRSRHTTLDLGPGQPYTLNLPIPGPSSFVHLKLKSRHRFDSPALLTPDDATYFDSDALVRSFVLRRDSLPIPGDWTLAGVGRGKLKFRSRQTMPLGNATITIGCY